MTKALVKTPQNTQDKVFPVLIKQYFIEEAAGLSTGPSSYQATRY